MACGSLSRTEVSMTYVRRLDEEDTGLPFLGAVRYPRPAPPLRVWPGWMTSTELRRFAPRRVTVHASPPRRTAYCVPHSDGTSADRSKARATPGISRVGNLTLGQFSGSLEREPPMASSSAYVRTIRICCPGTAWAA